MMYLYTTEGNYEIPTVKFDAPGEVGAQAVIADDLPNQYYLIDFSQFPPVSANEHFDRIYATYKNGYQLTVRLAADFEGDLKTSWGFTDPSGEYMLETASSSKEWSFLILGFGFSSSESAPRQRPNHVFCYFGTSTSTAEGTKEALIDGWVKTFGTSGSRLITYESGYVSNMKATILTETYLKGSFGGSPSFPGDDSSTGGGGGDFDNSSDDIGVPDVPSIGVSDTGMVTMFAPTIGNINQLASFLWSTDFIDNIKKLFQDPMEAIISLSIINVVPNAGSNRNIKVGFIDSGVSAPVLNSQYHQIDCGSVNLKEYWGNALDYSPYTQLEIFLPYIGIQKLNIDDCMNATINVKYNIDLLTGACMAFVSCSKGNLNSVLYTFSGNCAMQIPLSGSNLTGVINSLASIVTGVGLGLATGGSSAVASVAAGTAMNVINSKMHVQKSGRLDANVGAVGTKYPYLILTRPIQSLAKQYNKLKGYPSNITYKLSTLKGFTKVEDVHLDDISATSPELDQIERLLTTGVIL